jgi:hypothetical protein
MKKHTVISALMLGLAWTLLPPAAYAAGDFTAGSFQEYDPAGTSYRDHGICQFFTGPRGALGAGQFMLTIGDPHSSNYEELKITGDYAAMPSVLREFALFPDDDPNKVVTFEQYDGSYTLETLKTLRPVPANQWTTDAADNPYIPAAACGRFHLNFWMGDYEDAVKGFNPPPKTLPQEVVVTNFEFGK